MSRLISLRSFAGIFAVSSAVLAWQNLAIAQQTPPQNATAADALKSDMPNHQGGSVIEKYNDELARLRDYVAGSIDPCRNAIYCAAKNSKVRAILLRNLGNENYIFKGVRCLDGPGIPEQRRVLFDFDCRPGIFCLIDPNVLVTVDVVAGSVVDIVDPYIIGSDSTKLGHAAHGGFALRATAHHIDITNRGLKFVINGVENPPIRVALGDNVEVTFTTGGNHDWTLVYVENGSEVQWAQAGPNQTITFTADRAGEFDYFCSVGTHRQQGMKGKFIVEE